MIPTPDDKRYMGLALELAEKAAGRTHPNPMVGCFVVKDGEIVGSGYHEAAGLEHAEVVALKEAGPRARGATLYVTLEPCAHHGRTPPCAEAVAEAGVAKVVAATLDPNPLVAGKGMKIIEEAGIETSVGVEGERARKLNEGFMLAVVEKRAFVHLKLAATLDGRIATASGDSKWVSSPESREAVHRLRDRVSAMIVGVQTALEDDPHLTVRLPGEEERHILRVILDPRLRIDTGLWMLAPQNAAQTLIVTLEGAEAAKMEQLEGLGAKVLTSPNVDGGIDLGYLLEELCRQGHNEVLVEGGGRTARSFLDAGLVDRVHLYYAPKLLGGTDAIPMLGGTSPALMADAVALEELELERVGPDIYVTAKLAGKSEE